MLASIAGLWLCYFVLTTLRSEVLGFGFPLEMMWRRALACLAGIGDHRWCCGWSLRLFDARPLWMKIIAALLLSVPAAVLLVESNDAGLRRHRGKGRRRTWPPGREA